jgi:hypothetical protein
MRTGTQRHIVANIFQAASFVLGIPSLISVAFLSWEWLRLRFLSPQPSQPYKETGSQAVDLFVLSFGLIGKLLELLGGAVEWLLGVLVILSLLCLSFAVCLHLTARGLYAGRAWARVCGMLLASLVLLSSALLTSALPKYALSPMALLACGALYVLWVLGWRFI